MKTYLSQAIDFGELKKAIPAEPGSLLSKEITIGDIVSSFLPYLFVLAGLTLLVYLIAGGFQLMTSGGSPEAVEQGKKKVTNAFIGFIIIFVSYWLMQILQTVFGLTGPFTP